MLGSASSSYYYSPPRESPNHLFQSPLALCSVPFFNLWEQEPRSFSSDINHGLRREWQGWRYLVPASLVGVPLRMPIYSVSLLSAMVSLSSYLQALIRFQTSLLPPDIQDTQIPLRGRKFISTPHQRSQIPRPHVACCFFVSVACPDSSGVGG